MFLGSGMNDFISKPIEINKLEAVLAKWIPRDKRIKNELREAEDSPELSAQPART
jgi:FixJ family two-component response regulator